MADDVAEPREESPAYRLRFGIAYILLAALVGAAVGTFIVLAGRPSAEQKAWSAWRPSGTPDERLNQITDRVAHAYRLPSGNQLVGVLAQTPSVVNDNQSQEIRAFGLATPSPTTGTPNITFVPTEGAVEFILCGIRTQDCSIREDKPTPQRLRLLRRQALELALYTFRYVDGVKSVFAVLPPRSGSRPELGLFFRKSDLDDVLEHPLDRTLRRSPPPNPEALPRVEANVIDRLTVPHLHKFSYQPVADGSLVVVLGPAA